MIKLMLFPVVAILLVTAGLAAFFIFVRKDENQAVRVAESGAKMIIAAAKAFVAFAVTFALAGVFALIVGTIIARIFGFF